jgi:hypothetical protein
MSSMLSAPATIAATNAATFDPACAPRSVGTVNCSSTRPRSPTRSASASTGTSPAADTRLGSSNRADDSENVWQSRTCWMPFVATLI